MFYALRTNRKFGVIIGMMKLIKESKRTILLSYFLCVVLLFTSKCFI